MNIFQLAISAGYSAFPCEGKRPALPSWKQYMSQLPAISDAQEWTGNIAVVCGKISGGLTCIDFDVKNGNRFEQFLFDVDNIKPELLSKLYFETTPSGGYHVMFRSEFNMRSKKLACNPDGPAMIETKGEGGYVVCAPSTGYAVYYGKLSRLESISKDDAMLLIVICEGYNELEIPEYKPSIKTHVNGDSVFDRYDSANNPVQLLIAHGWKVTHTRGDKVYLRRPKKDNGISATWNYVPGRFYCFSTSTQFDSEHVYKPSAVYAILEHGGDFRAARKALSEEYGT